MSGADLHERGYQYQSMDSFHAGGATVESVYVDGVSITYTDSGSRMHLWTYVVAPDPDALVERNIELYP